MLLLGIAFGLTAPLAACGGSDEPDAAIAEEPPPPAARPDPQPTGCPRVSIVGDAAQLVTFRPGAGRDLTDITMRGVIAGFDGGCEYFEDHVGVTMRLSIVAERGPAGSNNDANFNYFIAVADPQERILNKEIFATSVTFPVGGSQAGTLETLEYRIPLDRPASGSFYRVLVGFQLTPDQLEYNRARN